MPECSENSTAEARPVTNNGFVINMAYHDGWLDGQFVFLMLTEFTGYFKIEVLGVCAAAKPPHTPPINQF